MARTGVSWLFGFLLHPGASLSRRVVQAGFWAFSLNMILSLTTTAKTIVLARLLSPEAFGLIGITIMVLALVDTFSRTGFRMSLVQRKGDIHPYLNTAWVIEIFRGIALTALVVAAAPLIARFFNAPSATLIIQVMALSGPIKALGNIGIVYFQKELEFHKQFLYRFAQTAPEVIIAISLAFWLQSVWALVYGFLAGVLAQTIISYFLHPYRPRLKLELGKARDLFGFGKWVLLNDMLVYLSSHLDEFVVGRALGVTSLGFYRMAYNLSHVVSSQVSNIANRVAFPAYAKVQDRRDTVLKMYFESLQLIVLVAFPAGIGILILGRDFVQVLLGEKWLPMLGALQLLALFGIAQAMGATVGSLYLGIGRPDLPTKFQFFRLAVMGAIIYPMIMMWGIMGAAGAALVSYIVLYPFRVWYVIRLLGCPIRECLKAYPKALALPAASSLSMAGGIYLAKQLWAFDPSVVSLIGLVALGVVVYTGTLLLGDTIFRVGLRAGLQRRLAIR